MTAADPTPRPLVVTLALPDDIQAGFDDARRRWFPAGRTQVGAHVTLFHAVPGRLEDLVRADLAAHGQAAFPVRVARVVSLGRGAAYALESDELARRHRALQQAWRAHLTRQDQQPLRAHVTVANKVTPERARETVSALQIGFAPYDVDAIGFDLWRYEGGPWTHLTRVPFAPRVVT